MAIHQIADQVSLPMAVTPTRASAPKARATERPTFVQTDFLKDLVSTNLKPGAATPSVTRNDGDALVLAIKDTHARTHALTVFKDGAAKFSSFSKNDFDPNGDGFGDLVTRDEENGALQHAPALIALMEALMETDMAPLATEDNLCAADLELELMKDPQFSRVQVYVPRQYSQGVDNDEEFWVE